MQSNPKDKSQLTAFKKKQAIISKIVIIDENSPKTLWGKEMKLLNGLVKKYGIDLLYTLPSTKPWLPSLAWFLTPNGKEFLMNAVIDYKKRITNIFPEAELIILLDKKVDNDIIIEKKPKTIKDFLNLYK